MKVESVGVKEIKKLTSQVWSKFINVIKGNLIVREIIIIIRVNFLFLYTLE